MSSVSNAGRRLAPDMSWGALLNRLKAAVPDAFDEGGRAQNLIGGRWVPGEVPRAYRSPVDESDLGALPFASPASAEAAVRFARDEFEAWAKVPLDERQRKVSACLDALRTHRDLLANLLTWEIGKTPKAAAADVDRCISGVAWYVEQVGPMLDGRSPLGVVSNIASWNYPMSVMAHALLVQALCGNAVLAKTPTDGGLYTLTLFAALAREAGLPVSLLSGSGSELAGAILRTPLVACIAFVGGKTGGRDVVAKMARDDQRHMVEMEGVNAYGVWNFSDWPSLAAQVRQGYEYGKQRCTAYPRFVVQRRLFPAFLDMHLPVVKSLRVGNPALEAPAGGPSLDFGPLINAKKVAELRGQIADALAAGAVPLHVGRLDPNDFAPGQSTATYLEPHVLLSPPRNSALYHHEPFGPVDTIVLVDTVEELIAEMNVSNGSLVASVACDDAREAALIAGELRAFKVGVNRVRSRGDRDEVFGGVGASWKGCFVGGKYLAEAVTLGSPGEQPYGNFPTYQKLPEPR
jgi:acyl-CoA reductase-like NAD-dependent aldehyde dehydrogenase